MFGVNLFNTFLPGIIINGTVGKKKVHLDCNPAVCARANVHCLLFSFFFSRYYVVNSVRMVDKYLFSISKTFHELVMGALPGVKFL